MRSWPCGRPPWQRRARPSRPRARCVEAPLAWLAYLPVPLITVAHMQPCKRRIRMLCRACGL